jgi:hypothetical protein
MGAPEVVGHPVAKRGPGERRTPGQACQFLIKRAVQGFEKSTVE